MKKIKEILIKLNNWKFIISVMLLLVLGGSFYWFQLKPNIIKRQCSWFTYTTQTPAVPAFEGVTKEKAEIRFIEMQKDNKQFYENMCGYGHSRDPLCKYTLASMNSSAKELEMPPRPAIPADPIEKVTRDASKTEYEECLRHHGI